MRTIPIQVHARPSKCRITTLQTYAPGLHNRFLSSYTIHIMHTEYTRKIYDGYIFYYIGRVCVCVCPAGTRCVRTEMTRRRAMHRSNEIRISPMAAARNGSIDL